jgi:hypothetical protein
MLEKTQFKKDGIERHLGMLEMMLARNAVWSTEKTTPEIRKAHDRITDLIRQMRDEYVAILELYVHDGR